jgi:hypothetical protein
MTRPDRAQSTRMPVQFAGFFTAAPQPFGRTGHGLVLMIVVNFGVNKVLRTVPNVVGKVASAVVL